jgi:hypothetical protein
LLKKLVITSIPSLPICTEMATTQWGGIPTTSLATALNQLLPPCHLAQNADSIFDID